MKKKQKNKFFPNCIDYCKRASTICCRRWALWWCWCCWCSECSHIIHSILALTEWCQRQCVRHCSPVGFFLVNRALIAGELLLVSRTSRGSVGTERKSTPVASSQVQEVHTEKVKLFVWIQRFYAAHRHSGHPGESWCAWELHYFSSSFSSAVEWRSGAQNHGSWSMWHFTPMPPMPLFLSKDAAVWFWLSSTVRLKWKRRLRPRCPNCRYPVAWQRRATCRYLFWNSLLRRRVKPHLLPLEVFCLPFLIFRTSRRRRANFIAVSTGKNCGNLRCLCILNSSIFLN